MLAANKDLEAAREEAEQNSRECKELAQKVQEMQCNALRKTNEQEALRVKVLELQKEIAALHGQVKKLSGELLKIQMDCDQQKAKHESQKKKAEEAHH